MKTLEQLGISPAPWSVDSHNNIRTDDGHTLSATIVSNAYGHDRTKNDARLIAASPKLYEKAYEVADNLRIHLAVPTQTITMNRDEVEAMARELEYALARAAGESEVRK